MRAIDVKERLVACKSQFELFIESEKNNVKSDRGYYHLQNLHILHDIIHEFHELSMFRTFVLNAIKLLGMSHPNTKHAQPPKRDEKKYLA